MYTSIEIEPDNYTNKLLSKLKPNDPQHTSKTSKSTSNDSITMKTTTTSKPQKIKWLSSKKSNILILSILTLSIAIAAPHTKSLKTPAKCYACDIGLKLILPRLKKENLSDSETVAILQEGCSIFKIQSKAVCFGAINNMKDQVVSVVKELNLSPKEVCSIIPGLQMCWPELSPWDRKTWRVRIPDKNLRFEPRVKFEPEIEKKGKLSLEGKMKSAKMETGSMKILHLSDIHIDPDYTPGASANCKEPLCCRKKVVKAHQFLGQAEKQES
jgi:hypothetical protein